MRSALGAAGILLVAVAACRALAGPASAQDAAPAPAPGGRDREAEASVEATLQAVDEAVARGRFESAERRAREAVTRAEARLGTRHPLLPHRRASPRAGRSWTSCARATATSHGSCALRGSRLPSTWAPRPPSRRQRAPSSRPSQATEGRFRDAVRGSRLVHVATHGFAREDLLAGLREGDEGAGALAGDASRHLAAGHDPMLVSALALAGANARDGAEGDDGILTALEASHLDAEAVELVTLSACETARGTAASGEGVQGLVRGFASAGARNVAASLWRVDDRSTAILMGRFYEGLLRPDKPLPPARAMRAAAVWLRDLPSAAEGPAPGAPTASAGDRGRLGAGAAGSGTDARRPFASPRHWASFVVYGP